MRQMDCCLVANLKTVALQIDARCVLALANKVGNSGMLWPQALCQLYLPSATNAGICGWHLENDPSFGNGIAVITAVNEHDKSICIRQALGLSGRHVGKCRHAAFASMNGKTHGKQRSRQKYQKQNQRYGEETQEAGQSVGLSVGGSLGQRKCGPLDRNLLFVCR